MALFGLGRVGRPAPGAEAERRGVIASACRETHRCSPTSNETVELLLSQSTA